MGMYTKITRTIQIKDLENISKEKELEVMMSRLRLLVSRKET